MTRLVAIYLLPPFAIARLGASETPVEAFDWVEDPATHGAGRTVIRPAVSLRVRPDGSVQPYMPSVILFRDSPGQKIRPTAPFFELWGRFDDAAEPQPLTATHMEAVGGSLGRVVWCIRAANLKAQRRTKSPADGFAAEITGARQRARAGAAVGGEPQHRRFPAIGAGKRADPASRPRI
jgi:hypothetical protein